MIKITQEVFCLPAHVFSGARVWLRRNENSLGCKKEQSASCPPRGKLPTIAIQSLSMTNINIRDKTFIGKLQNIYLGFACFLSTGGTSTWAPVCLSVLRSVFIKIGFVIITLWYFLRCVVSEFGINGFVLHLYFQLCVKLALTYLHTCHEKDVKLCQVA